MSTAQKFEDLVVWQEARQLVGAVYSASRAAGFNRDFSLRDQIRRAAISTMSNIAEGFESGTRKEFVWFLTIAKRSNGEVRSQLHVALDQKYISQVEFEHLRDSTVMLSKKLAVFIRYLEGYTDNARIKKPSRADGVNRQPATFDLQLT